MKAPERSGMFWDVFDVIYQGSGSGLSPTFDISHISFTGHLHRDRFRELWDRINRGNFDPRLFEEARTQLTKMTEAYESDPKLGMVARGMRKFYGAQLGWMEARLPRDDAMLENIRKRSETELYGWKRRNELRIDDYVPDIMGGLPPDATDPWAEAYKKLMEDSSEETANAVAPGVLDPGACAGLDVANGDFMECVGQVAGNAFVVPEANPITDAAVEATKPSDYPPLSSAHIDQVYDTVAGRHSELLPAQPYVDATMGGDRAIRSATNAGKAAKDGDWWDAIGSFFDGFGKWISLGIGGL
ncbi:MAG: hypothetical protein V1887_01005, partial [Candidatus Aenigmatarchaeota archaeon]